MFIIIGVLSMALFALLSAMPGNPLDMLITSNPQIKPEDIVRIKKLRGLDKPWYVQYSRWLWGYDQPALPPLITRIDPIKINNNLKNISINLDSYISDPNFIPRREQLTKWIDSLWPDWPKSLASTRLKASIEEGDVGAILLLVADHDPGLQNKLKALIEKESSKNLIIKGLFGAHVSKNILEKNIKNNLEDLWFVVENSYGQQKVGHIVIQQENIKNILQPIKTQLSDKLGEVFELNLNKFAFNNKKFNYELLENSPGTLSSEGIYRHIFNHDGQSVVSFLVRDQDHNEQRLAFDIEHGVIGNQEKFNKGFLFFFAGDRNALGFSETYKRPVYDLLFGPQIFCGDGRVDPGESCDVGIDNNTCTQSCFFADQSFLSKLNITIGGFIYRSGRIGNTIQLMLPALIFSLLVAIPLGILSAYRQYSLIDYIINFFAFVGISLPVFWFGIMMIYIFAESWLLLPAGGIQTPGISEFSTPEILWDRIQHAILPTLVLSIFYVGRWLRYIRASMLEVLPEDYIRTARAKGLSEKSVVLKHGFRNALIPIVTILAISIPSLFGGAVLTETVFSWPGIGRLQYEAVMNSDYYVAIVVFLISAVLVMLGNLIADIIYVLLDPRIRKL